MKQQQAIEILKQVVDEALKAGVFKTIEAAAIVYNALETLKKDDHTTDSN
jgi:hypothetical protein